MNKQRIFIVTLAVAVSLVTAFSTFGRVNSGQRGVLVTLGKVHDQPLGEGMYAKIPFAQKVVGMNVRIQKEETDATAATRDLQDVTLKVALNYHLDPLKAADVYRDVGRDYGNVIVFPKLQEQVKAATAKFTAEELITRRDEVSAAIMGGLRDNLSPYGLVVDTFNVVNFSFSRSFSDSIEKKVTAEQDALAAKNRLEQVKFEAEQRVAQATAEAEAIRIQATAIQQQGGANYVQLKAVEKWNGVLPTYLTGNTPIPFIDVGR